MTQFGIDSTVFNILLGAVISILTTALVWATLHFNQRRIRRDRTRRTVYYEVNHIADNIEQLIDLNSGTIDEDDIDSVLVTLSPDALEEDFRQINKLTSPEVESIYGFYEFTRVLKRKLQRQEGGDGETKQKEVRRAAENILDKRDEVKQNVRRSRASLFTEWLKELDRRIRDMY